DADDLDLGYTYSRPSIVPLEGPSNSIRWAAIFGNGYNDAGSGEAKLFVVFLEGGLDGTWTSGTDYIEISTDSGNTTNRNGLSTPAVVDTNGDGLADRVYAGDLFGEMWAFDLSGQNTGNWDVAYKQANTPKPLFVSPP
ncbi:MAG: PilC/PilY family type IV pilus protein, partial [Woeseiales bacterium]